MTCPGQRQNRTLGGAGEDRTLKKAVQGPQFTGQLTAPKATLPYIDSREDKKEEIQESILSFTKSEKLL